MPSDTLPPGGTSSSSSSSSGSEDAATAKTPSPQKADSATATAAATQVSSKTKKVWTYMKQKTASHAMHEMLLDCMVQLRLLRRCYMSVLHLDLAVV
jgi:hypothetical protein